jgi:hypothetical protein
VVKKLFNDVSYDDRKVLNSVDVIKAIKQMGYSYDQIGKICGVSKTMISRWGNPNIKDSPTKKQLQPVLQKVGAGRVICDVEILSPAARKYPPIYNVISVLLFGSFILLCLWFSFVESCVSNYEKCGALPWYEMVSFSQNELKLKIEALQACSADNKFHNKSLKQDK